MERPDTKQPDKPDFEKMADEYAESFKTGEWFERLRKEAFMACVNTVVTPLQKENERLNKEVIHWVEEAMKENKKLLSKDAKIEQLINDLEAQIDASIKWEKTYDSACETVEDLGKRLDSKDAELAELREVLREKKFTEKDLIQSIKFGSENVFVTEVDEKIRVEEFIESIIKELK